MCYQCGSLVSHLSNHLHRYRSFLVSLGYGHSHCWCQACSFLAAICEPAPYYIFFLNRRSEMSNLLQSAHYNIDFIHIPFE